MEETNKKIYKIGYFMGSIFIEYPHFLFKGASEATLAAGHQFVKIGDQVSLNRNQIDFKSLQFAFKLAAELDLDAYLISPGSINNSYKIYDNNHSIDNLINMLPKDKVIMMDTYVEGYRSIYKNNKNGMREAMSHLIYNLKCKNIGFISGTENSPSSIERENVYFEEMKKAGLPCDKSYFRRATYWGNCEDIVEDLLNAHPELDAIATANDRIAFSCYNVLKTRGKKVGVDIAITGFDDLPDSAIQTPPLSTVHCSAYEIGKIAAEEAIRMCQGLPQETFYVDSYFIKRGSTGDHTVDLEDIAFQIIHDKNIDVPALTETLTDAFAKYSWKRHFGHEYEQHRQRVKELLEHFQSCYHEYTKRHDSTIDLFNEKVLRSYLKSCYEQKDFFLPGLQTALVSFGKALIKDSPIEERIYVISQFSNFNMMISQIFYSDINKQQQRVVNDEITTMDIMETAFSNSDDYEGSIRMIMKNISNLGINTAKIFVLSEPVDLAPNSILLNRDLSLSCTLDNGEITVYKDRSLSYKYNQMLDLILNGEIDYKLINISPLLSKRIVHGYIVYTDSINPFRQSAITQMLSYSLHHLHIIFQQKHMMELLNNNNILLENQSMIDEMTGLYNRRGFITHTGELIDKFQGHDAAFFYMDLDYLKRINDTYGHYYGDDAIRTLATVLRKCFNSENVLCRIGGDEFVAISVLDNGLTPDMIADNIKIEADRINKTSNAEYTLSVSIGYKKFQITEDIHSYLPTYIREADRALYVHKNIKKLISKTKEIESLDNNV